MKRWPSSRRGRRNIQRWQRSSSPRMCWLIRCAAVRRPGHAFASTSSTFPRESGRNRRNWRRCRTRGRTLTLRSGTENRGKLERRNDFELVVAAVPGRLVVAPAQERRRVPETIALHVVVLHFTHALDAQRFPRQILAGAPAALAPGHPLRRFSSLARRSLGEGGPWV